MTNKILNLDISKEPKLNPIIYGRVGDGGSQRVTLNTSKRDEQLDLTGYTITFEGVTSGGKTKVFDSDNVVVTSEGLKKGTFDYVFPNMAFAVKGKYERAYFSFIKDGIRDTSGEIEIIVLDNADIDAAEAETIITEYNKLVTELRKLQDQAIADMNQNFAATQAKISELEKQLSDTQSELQQALKDFENGNFWKKEESFNKEQSSANVVYQIIGKEKVRMDFTLDFDKKVFNSTVENPNWSGAAYGNNTLPDRSDFKNILSPQSRMDSLKSLDGNNVTATTVAGSANQYPCLEIKWDVVETLTRFLGEQFFLDRGAVDVASKANVAKQIIINDISSNIWGYGTSPNGNDFRTANLVTGTGWQLGSVPPNNSNVVKKLSAINSSGATIQPDGNIYTIVYASQSTVDKQSSINVDYATLMFSIEVSMNEHIKSMIATYSGENVNKNFVGLGNVDNYATATQAEAEAGTATNKFVTPKGVAAYVDSINKVAEYKITDKSQIPDANAAEWVDELEAVFKRRGDRVDFFCRINFNKSTGTYTPGYFRLPQGFRLSTEFNNFIWNVPLAITKYVNADEFRGVAFAERQSSGGNYIRIGNKVTGNHWVSGTWYTDDPFPSVAGS